MMRFSPIVLLALAGTLAADVPKTPTLTRYARLWTNSPFTSKPPPPEQQAEDNPLEDYALGGISKLADGYYAILINKKNPNEPKQIIRPGSASEFEILEVKWSDNNWKDTVAVVRHGSNRGMVKFDDKLLTVTSAAPDPQANPQPNAGQPPGLPPGVVPPQPGQPPTPQATNGDKKPTVRTPRPRVVVPPKQ